MPSPFPGHACVPCASYVEKAGGQMAYTELRVELLEVESEDPKRIYSSDNYYESRSLAKIRNIRKSAS